MKATEETRQNYLHQQRIIYHCFFFIEEKLYFEQNVIVKISWLFIEAHKRIKIFQFEFAFIWSKTCYNSNWLQSTVNNKRNNYERILSIYVTFILKCRQISRLLLSLLWFLLHQLIRLKQCSIMWCNWLKPGHLYE